jgi:hypothetical protein
MHAAMGPSPEKGRVDNKVLGGEGTELPAKTPTKTHISKQAAAESAAFDADFNFVKESWPLLPDEIRAAIVATAKRGLNRQASRRMAIAAGGL